MFIFILSSILLVACQPQVNQQHVNQSDQSDQQSAPATGNSNSEPNSNVEVSTQVNFDGTYTGEIQRGYDISFKVEGSKVIEVVANVLEQCSDSSTTNVTTVYFDGPFDINADGSVFIEGIDDITNGDFIFTAMFNEDGTASGTLLQKYAITGVVCTTGELAWDSSKN